MPTIPFSLILSAAERDEIARHLAELDRACGPTPADDVGAEEATLVVVTGELGELGIAPRHAPLITRLKPGKVVVTLPSGEQLDFAIGGGILGASTILSWGSTVNVVVTLRRNDYVIFESPTLNFRYEQATGPAGFNIGVWGYFVCAARLGGLSVTAA